MKKMFLLLAMSILFIGCGAKQQTVSHDLKLNNEFYIVKEVSTEKNLFTIQYRADKIATGYFEQELKDFCKERKMVLSLNEIKVIDNIVEEASYSCIIR